MRDHQSDDVCGQESCAWTECREIPPQNLMTGCVKVGSVWSIVWEVLLRRVPDAPVRPELGSTPFRQVKIALEVMSPSAPVDTMVP